MGRTLALEVETHPNQGLSLTSRRRAREIEYSLADDHVVHIILDAIRHAAES
jgi:hypothetical protein